MVMPTHAVAESHPQTAESFKELGRRLSNWRRWGPDDQRGTLNLITPERVAAASRLVTAGKMFSLAVPLSSQSGQTGGRRSSPLHLLSQMPGDTAYQDGAEFADDFIVMPLHSGTHWDGLAHCAYDGQLYNGYPTSSITASGGAGRCGIDQLGAAVVGRGVLLDVARARGVECLPPGAVIDPADLEAAETEQGVRAGSGDVLLVRTGWSVKLQAPRPARGLPPDAQARRPVAQPEPGLSQACCEWLHAREIAAVAADNYALEVIPVEDRAATLPVHCVLIRDMGMTIGELFNLEELARDCAADGQWQFLFMAPPLRLVNGLGSPINPIVLK